MQKLLLFVLSMLMGYHLSAQSLAVEINDYFDQLRQQPNTKSLSFRNDDGKDALQGLATLQKYQLDSLATVRQEAYRLVHELVQQATDQEMRIKGVNQLVQGIRDNGPGIQRWVAQRLSQYEKDVFSPDSHQLIEQVIRQRNAAFAELVLIAGYLELKNIAPLFVELLKTSATELTTEEKWNVHLAMARMGDPLFINYCVRKVKKFGVNDDVVYELLSGLIYIRQPESFAYLQALIFDDEKSCTVADMESEGNITCAYRILEMVTPYIQNFPLQLAAGGDIEGQNYPVALQTARDWFLSHQTYTLKREVY